MGLTLGEKKTQFGCHPLAACCSSVERKIQQSSTATETIYSKDFSKKHFKLLISEYLFHMCTCQWMPEDSARSPDLECRAGNQTQLLWRAAHALDAWAISPAPKDFSDGPTSVVSHCSVVLLGHAGKHGFGHGDRPWRMSFSLCILELSSSVRGSLEWL